MTVRRLILVVLVTGLIGLMPGAPNAAAHTSSGVACKVSYNYEGSSGNTTYWRFIAKLINNRNKTTSIKAEVDIDIGITQYFEYFAGRVPKLSYIKVRRDVALLSGNPDVRVPHCHATSA